MGRHALVAVGIMVIVALGGVVLLFAGGFLGGEESPQSNTGGESPTDADVRIGPLQYRNDTNRFTPEVTFDVYGYENLSYENVTFCLYDRNGAVLYSEPLGPFYSPEEGGFYKEHVINITLETRPKYVTVDHPGLWNDSRIGVDFLEWDSGSRSWGILREFKLQRTHEPGKCG